MEEIDSLTFTRWVVFNAIEPMGPDRADFNMARLLALTHNANRGESDPARTPKDYMLDFWTDEVLNKASAVDTKKANRELLDAVAGIPGVKVTVMKPEELGQ